MVRFPRAFPTVHGQVRKAVLRRFPYSLLFIDLRLPPTPPPASPGSSLPPPVDTEGMLDLGRSYLALGDVQRAQDQYDAYLRMYPQEPRARVGLAKVMINLGEMEEAVGHLDDALAVWAEAEPGFQPAIEARRLRAELGGSSPIVGSGIQ